MELPPAWHALIGASDLPAALVAHLSPVLGTTPENQALLERIATRAERAYLDTSHPEAQYHRLVIDLGKDTLACSLPGEPNEEGLRPHASFVRIVALHRRMQLQEAQVDMFHETYVEDEGWLDGTGLEGKGVFAPLRVYSDMYICHPEETTESGEPVLYFLDHEVMEEDGPQRVEGDIARVFLEQVAKRVA